MLHMNKVLCLGAGLLALSCSSAFAQTASSKQTAAISTVSVAGCSSNSTVSMLPCVDAWVDVTPALTIKTSNSTSLFVDASLVTGLYTSTQVKGNNTGATSSATAAAGVHVRVLLDGVVYAYPDQLGSGITFDSRVQTLTANLGNIFTSACAASPATCTLTAEQITLVLDTSSAHSFNFILLNVGAGTHTVQVQAQTDAHSTASTGGVAISNAVYGPGSVTIDAVRLVHDFSF
jgi:hypothetical protein